MRNFQGDIVSIQMSRAKALTGEGLTSLGNSTSSKLETADMSRKDESKFPLDDRNLSSEPKPLTVSCAMRAMLKAFSYRSYSGNTDL